MYKAASGLRIGELHLSVQMQLHPESSLVPGNWPPIPNASKPTSIDEPYFLKINLEFHDRTLGDCYILSQKLTPQKEFISKVSVFNWSSVNIRLQVGGACTVH